MLHAGNHKRELIVIGKSPWKRAQNKQNKIGFCMLLFQEISPISYETPFSWSKSISPNGSKVSDTPLGSDARKALGFSSGWPFGQPELDYPQQHFIVQWIHAFYLLKNHIWRVMPAILTRVFWLWNTRGFRSLFGPKRQKLVRRFTGSDPFCSAGTSWRRSGLKDPLRCQFGSHIAAIFLGNWNGSWRFLFFPWEPFPRNSGCFSVNPLISQGLIEKLDGRLRKTKTQKIEKTKNEKKKIIEKWKISF